MKYRLSELANIRNGKKPKTKKLNAKYEIYGSNGIIGYTDKSNSGKNTIVIGRVGANAGSVLFSENESWVSDNAIIVTPKDDSIAYYLYYLLKKSSLNKFVSGSAQPLINQSILNSIHLRLIGKESQLKVAQFLRKLDSKIELNNQIISNLEELASTLFKRWFVEFEFPDKNGNPYKSSGGKMIDSELGEIPESFSVENFGSHIKYISKGTTPTKKDLLSSKSIKNVKYLKVKDIPSVGMINYKNLEEIPEDVHEKQLKRSALKKGDIILSIAGTIGRVNIISSETELNTNQAVSFIRQIILIVQRLIKTSALYFF
ncbi:restriction endonuclease subunit S [Enterococcus faecalis]|nr:restriction endonuclease subunit S [Enterococcus faecalis]